ncbi:chlorophyll synthase ChlG [Rhodoplanes sp. TEM]|uniref:Chlorophyll synthase ChlG n=1 Tax=Rhodoplanes tepidamans TaxID=200616 RepID=A0ABT5J571_RHOTP|nr:MULTISPECIES: chlorophyll synthase ChlG [Rhodoplanes]MDC7784597.1 chlorophyll synthase ChlG [Rhodoplanes tepidamans]MDC7982889.1 chlorophyll synthase ChlG [Rhodoplanes sp. TEM]MDQ0355825.1 chlorophyll synthase [Rhodoplanes tepidamans]
MSVTTTMQMPAPSAVLELLKPITWFPPMWAFACGVVSSGLPLGPRWPVVVAGIVLCGPLLVATSQVVNDWFDRHVDAINEPHRPIPSGRIPGRWGLWLAILWTAMSLALASQLGGWVFGAAAVGLVLAWLYSAPPVRLKQNGWWGNAACAITYEGFAWFTGAAVMIGGLPDWRIVTLAFLYSAGAHGIMTLNDFKSIEGDIRTGVRSLPVQFGVDAAARLACVVMALPQLAVIVLLASWDRPVHAAIVTLLLVAQGALAMRFLAAPIAKATWFSGLGVTLYVLGMMTSAVALAAFGAPA